MGSPGIHHRHGRRAARTLAALACALLTANAHAAEEIVAPGAATDAAAEALPELATPVAAEPAEAAKPDKTEPDVVIVGAYLNDVQSLDLKTHTFAADLYLWFRWKNADIDPTATLEFMNPSELWGHTKTNDFEKPEALDDGEQYQVVHLQGRFSCKLPLYDYPFDRQTLFIEFEDSNLATTAMNYLPDAVPLKVNPALKLPGFDVGQGRLVVRKNVYETNFGDPRVKGHDAFSRGRIELEIRRPLLPHAIKMLLPVLCVVLCASMMFLFGTQYVDSRVELGITSLLTVVALQMTMNDNLPEVAYLVLIDKVYLATYLFVIFGFLLVVRETRLVDRGDQAGAERLNRRGLVMGALFYLGTVATLILPTVLAR